MELSKNEVKRDTKDIERHSEYRVIFPVFSMLCCDTVGLRMIGTVLSTAGRRRYSVASDGHVLPSTSS